MKVLVIEDKEIHRDSARKTLCEHEVTIAPSYDEAVKVLNGSQEAPFEFDAVLTDMNMPMSNDGNLNPKIFNSDEQVPYGFVLALMAAHRGAKYVAMVTDTNHHFGAMSAALNNLGPPYWKWGTKYRQRFNINGALVIFVHAPLYRAIIGGKYQKEEQKDWGAVLAELVTST